MTTVKRSVSLDIDLDRELSDRFGAGAKSRFLNEAGWDALARFRMLELLEEMDRDTGPVPESVYDEVRALARPR